MKKLKIANYIFIINTFYYIIYNFYFGWNRLPINKAEEICDYIYRFAFGFSLFYYFSVIYTIIEYNIKKIENEKLENDKDS